MNQTTGDQRRREELNHPERTLTSEEKSERKELVFILTVIFNLICLLFMIIIAIFLIIISSYYTGFDAFYIVLLGMISNVIITMLIANKLGNRIKKLYEEMI